MQLSYPQNVPVVLVVFRTKGLPVLVPSSPIEIKRLPVPSPGSPIGIKGLPVPSP